MGKNKTPIDVYIQKFSKEEQLQMETLRKLVQNITPAEEGISYNMPSFKWNGKIVACFQMYKNHLGFYPYSGNITKLFKKELKNFAWSDGAVQFPKDKPLPKELIKKMILARIGEVVSSTIYYYTCPKPLGHITISLDTEGKITKCVFKDTKEKSWQKVSIDISKALDGYFKNKKPLPKNLISKNIVGTPFQKNVWKEISKIPFRKKISYKDLALKIGDSNAVRAVGTACGKNPVALFIPCHRVQSSLGTNTGYAWGKERKDWLLEFEKNRL